MRGTSLFVERTSTAVHYFWNIASALCSILRSILYGVVSAPDTADRYEYQSGNRARGVSKLPPKIAHRVFLRVARLDR